MASATRGAKSKVTGEPVAGPETLPKEELAKLCADTPGEAKRHRFRDDYYAARTAEFENIQAPMSVRRQLGRRRPAHARQFRRLARRRLQAEMAGGAWRHAFHAFLQRIRRRLCRSVSSLISSRARTAAGASSRAFRSTSAIRAKNSCCAPRTNGRSRARNGRNISCSRTASALQRTRPRTRRR